LADTGISTGTARRTAEAMACSSSGSISKAAPPPCRLTTLAGQPKFRSMPAGPSVARRAAFSAMQPGSEPSSCARTGTPACVRPPWSSSGTMRVKTRSGSNWSVMRMNSDTQRSMPPTRVRMSRSGKSSRPSMGASRMVMAIGK